MYTMVLLCMYNNNDNRRPAASGLFAALRLFVGAGGRSAQPVFFVGGGGRSAEVGASSDARTALSRLFFGELNEGAASSDARTAMSRVFFLASSSALSLSRMFFAVFLASNSAIAFTSSPSP